MCRVGEMARPFRSMRSSLLVEQAAELEGDSLGSENFKLAHGEGDYGVEVPGDELLQIFRREF